MSSSVAKKDGGVRGRPSARTPSPLAPRSTRSTGRGPFPSGDHASQRLDVQRAGNSASRGRRGDIPVTL